MSKLNLLPVEEIIKRTKVDVYPITIIKYFLNKRKILEMVEKLKNVENNSYIINRFSVPADNKTCEECVERKKSNFDLCRKHTSIERVRKANGTVLMNKEGFAFYNNEIFISIPGGTFIAYCPHPKLIAGDLTDQKIRKLDFIICKDMHLTKPEDPIVLDFETYENENLVCWFNYLFSIITIPGDNGYCNWALISNYKNGGTK